MPENPPGSATPSVWDRMWATASPATALAFCQRRSMLRYVELSGCWPPEQAELLYLRTFGEHSMLGLA